MSAIQLHRNDNKRLSDVPSTTACTDLSDKSNRCKNAVYNSQGQLQWAATSGPDSVRSGQEVVVVQGPLISCPTTECTQNTPSGVTFNTCVGTDLAGETSCKCGIMRCAALRVAVATCSKAVYNRVASVYRLENGNVALVSSTKADKVTVQLVGGVSSTPASGTSTTHSGTTASRLKACPAGETTQTFNGVVVATCPSTDYQGPTTQVTAAANIAACAQSCLRNNQYSAIYTGPRNHQFPSPPPPGSNTTSPSSVPNPSPPSQVSPASPAPLGKGQWSGIIQIPIIPAAGYIVPEYPESSRIQVFSSGCVRFSGTTNLRTITSRPAPSRSVRSPRPNTTCSALPSAPWKTAESSPQTALSSNSATNGFSVSPGGTLNVQMNDGTGVTFALVSIGSATHSVNNSGVLIPGPYFLFALSKDKIPSMAKTVRVTI
ncbi:hypothetical protein IFR05_007278 [Cadophora sp. M221]|nr:hypothetical protein IFR05_007278 [Cadophora sp. M221]